MTKFSDKIKRGCSSCQSNRFLVLLTIITSQKEKSRVAYNDMVKFLFKKTIVAYVFKIIYAGLLWYEGITTWHISEDIMDSGTAENISHFDTDHPFYKFRKSMTITLQISNLMRIPLALLYLKYPHVARSYYFFELFINMQEAFLVAKEPQMNTTIVYLHVAISFLTMVTIDFFKSVVWFLIYISVYIFAQSVVYENTVPEILSWNIPQALTMLISICIIQIMLGKFFELKLRE